MTIVSPTSTHFPRSLGAVCILSVLLGVLYVALVPAGLPYDEPAHWNIVQHYARGHFLPVMGTQGVDYEAYQTPLFYALGGLFVFITGQFGEAFSFYALRIVCLLLIIPILYATHYLATRAFGGNKPATLLAVLFVGCNPALLAIAASVQNDSPAIALSLLLMVLAVRRIGDAPQDDPLPARTAILLGTLCAVAILCKLTVAYLIFVLPLYVWLVRRNKLETMRFSGLYLLSIVLLTGWWFARNQMLYGDWTSAGAMRLYFPEAVPKAIALSDWRRWILVLQNILNYHWLPAEYFRGLVKVPGIIKMLIALATLSSLAGWAAFSARRIFRPAPANASPGTMQPGQDATGTRRTILLLTICYGLCLAIYGRNLVSEWFLPARMLLVALAAPVIFFIAGWEHWTTREIWGTRIRCIFTLLLLGTFCLIHFSMLRAATQLPSFDFIIRFTR